MAQEGNRRLPPHAGHRLRGRRGALRTGSGFRRSGLGRQDAGKLRVPRGRGGSGRGFRRADQAGSRRGRPQDRTSATKGPSSGTRSPGCQLHEGPRPRFQSRLEPLHDLSTTLGPIWEQETDRRSPGRHRPGPGGHSQGASRAAQAGRDGRGPRVRDRPQERSRGQYERPVHRDSLAAPSRGTRHRRGSGSAAAAATTTPPTPVHAQESGE